MSQFPVEIFLSHSAEIFRRGTLYCFSNFGYRKFFCFGGLCQKFRFSLEFFSSHSTVPKIFLGESFSVSFISAIKKFWKGGGGSISILRRSFCLTVTKFFIAEHFGLSEKFFCRKFS